MRCRRFTVLATRTASTSLTQRGRCFCSLLAALISFYFSTGCSHEREGNLTNKNNQEKLVCEREGKLLVLPGT